MTKSSNAGKDFVCRFGPAEWLRRLIVKFEIVSDGLFKLLGAAMDASTNLLFREGGEEALNHIDPRCTGGGEMNMEARPFG